MLSTNGQQRVSFRSAGWSCCRTNSHDELATLIVPDRFRWLQVTGIRTQQKECGIVAKPRSPRVCQDTKRARRANLAWVSDKVALRRNR